MKNSAAACVDVLKKQIDQYGKEYSFVKTKKNAYKESTSDIESQIDIKGLYHEQRTSTYLIAREGGMVAPKQVPMIMCLTKEVKDIDEGYNVMLLNGLAKVVTVNPLINVDEITEITLELITNAV